MPQNGRDEEIAKIGDRGISWRVLTRCDRAPTRFIVPERIGISKEHPVPDLVSQYKAEERFLETDAPQRREARSVVQVEAKRRSPLNDRRLLELLILEGEWDKPDPERTERDDRAPIFARVRNRCHPVFDLGRFQEELNFPSGALIAATLSEAESLRLDRGFRRLGRGADRR